PPPPYPPYPTPRLFPFTASSPPLLYPPSLHDALPICAPLFSAHCRFTIALFTTPAEPIFRIPGRRIATPSPSARSPTKLWWRSGDRKSTRLNSSHQIISYAVFCLKKKQKKKKSII